MSLAGRRSRKNALLVPAVDAGAVGPARHRGRGRAEPAATGVPDPGDLLAWYDRHRRKLPWRADAGERSDAYKVWLSEIMLQQTGVKTVAPYYLRFLTRFPSVGHLAAAPLDDVLRLWAGLGYYARARNLHACARAVVEHHGGKFPDTEGRLRTLPGVGAYTAAAISAIAFDRRASPVDGNIERVIARLFAVEDELPGAKSAIHELAARLTPQQRPGDFAQAMMDLGATICTPRNPACALCPWREPCTARARGEPESFPRKVGKRTGALRRGAAFVVLRAGRDLLVRTRPAAGLLGGMTEVPTTEWTHDFDESAALSAAPRFAGTPPTWRRAPGAVTHTFTHFPLALAVYLTNVRGRAKAPAGTRWVRLADLADEALPNVMRKVVFHVVKN